MNPLNFFKRKKLQRNQEEQRHNALWDLWAEEKVTSPYAQLMTYQSQINNGGHEQYFDNLTEDGTLAEEMAALEQILPLELLDNLKKAHPIYLKLQKNPEDPTAQEQLDACDDLFYEYEEEIEELLMEYAASLLL